MSVVLDDVVVRPAKAAVKEPVPDVSVPGAAAADGAGKDGWLPIGFDPSVVDTLSTLYGKWTSGLRELYANMVASCKRAAAEYGASPTIVITIDGRTVRLEDTDSCGMSRAVFHEGIAVAGNTGNYDPRSPGQWGLGSLSFVMMSDEMLIESHSRATGERFAALALRGGRFRTGDGVPEPDFEWFGTRMTLRLRDGLDASEAVDTAAKIAEMSGVDTVLRLYGNGVPRAVLKKARAGGDGCKGDGSEDEEEEEEEGDDGIEAAAIASIVSSAPHGGFSRTPDGRGAEVRLGRRDGLLGMVQNRVGHRGYDIGGIVYRRPTSEPCILAGGGGLLAVHAGNEDIEVAAVVEFNAKRRSRRGCYVGSYLYMNLRCPTWLAGMPVESEFPQSLRALIGVSVHCKNERRYRPTPDRERLSDEAEKRVAADAFALVLEKACGVRCGSLGEYLSDYGNRLAEAAPLIRFHGHPGRPWDETGRGAVDERTGRIAEAACEPIHVFGRGGPGPAGVQTLWSAVQCSGAPADAKGASPGSAGKRDGGRRMHLACDCKMHGGPGAQPVLVVAKTLSARKAAAVLEWCERNEPGRIAIVFRPDRQSACGVDKYVELGAVPIDEYMARNGIRPLQKGGAEAEAALKAARDAPLVAYGGTPDFSWRPYKSISEAKKIAPSDAGAGVVWCDNTDDMEAMKSIVSVVRCSTLVVKCGRRPGNATPFAEHARTGGGALYHTSAGRLAGAEIAGMKRRVVLVEYDGDAADLARHIGVETGGSSSSGEDAEDRAWRMVPCWYRGRRYAHSHSGARDLASAIRDGSEPALAVVGTADELALCAAHLHAASASYGVWPNMCGYGAPEYVERVCADGDDIFVGMIPSWIQDMTVHDFGDNEGKTLVSSILHGHLAVKHGQAAAGGSGGEDSPAPAAA